MTCAYFNGIGLNRGSNLAAGRFEYLDWYCQRIATPPDAEKSACCRIGPIANRFLFPPETAVAQGPYGLQWPLALYCSIASSSAATAAQDYKFPVPGPAVNIQCEDRAQNPARR